MLNNVSNPYHNNKLELISGAKVVTDHETAVALLKSDAFNVVDLKSYLSRLEADAELSFKRLIGFISLSPFFNEGDTHQILKKYIAVAFSKNNLNHWLPWFEQQINLINQRLEQGQPIDLVDYSFDIAKQLLRPLILGIQDGLPDDFEERLYNFQKIAEPLLSLKQLVALEAELEYLFSHLSKIVLGDFEPIKNSFPYLAKTNEQLSLTDDEKVMLLIVVYGAKSPLTQTLGNMFLQLLEEGNAAYIKQASDSAQEAQETKSVFSASDFTAQLDYLINNSASLLHIHRVAQQAFNYGEFSVQAGDYVLIRTRFYPHSHKEPTANENSLQVATKGLGFGLRAHYCSGAQLAKTVLGKVLPAFFERFPAPTIKSFSHDDTLHTATALTTLKVTL